MIESILLVGGQGTRLRPLTFKTPKPMLTVAGYPVTAHQLARAKQAGIGRVILGTAYRSEVFADSFGTGAEIGLDIVYSFEEEPLGTGGGIAKAGELLISDREAPVVVFNGDVLTGIDIAEAIESWRRSGADVGIYLVKVDDPRAYGLVPTDDQARVTAFLEKPTNEEEIVTDQINAGMYIMRRRVIDEIPKGQVISVEREIFPKLLRDGVPMVGIVDDGYWLDLGTPQALIQGSIDLVTGVAPSPLLDDNQYLNSTRTKLVFPDSSVDESAVVEGGTVVMPGARIESGAVVLGSVIGRGVTIGANARVENCYLADGVQVQPAALLQGEVMVSG